MSNFPANLSVKIFVIDWFFFTFAEGQLWPLAIVVAHHSLWTHSFVISPTLIPHIHLVDIRNTVSDHGSSSTVSYWNRKSKRFLEPEIWHFQCKVNYLKISSAFWYPQPFTGCLTDGPNLYRKFHSILAVFSVQKIRDRFSVNVLIKVINYERYLKKYKLI